MFFISSSLHYNIVSNELDSSESALNHSRLELARGVLASKEQAVELVDTLVRMEQRKVLACSVQQYLTVSVSEVEFGESGNSCQSMFDFLRCWHWLSVIEDHLIVAPCIQVQSEVPDFLLCDSRVLQPCI